MVIFIVSALRRAAPVLWTGCGLDALLTSPAAALIVANEMESMATGKRPLKTHWANNMDPGVRER
ncbi:hypothetical protein K788_0001854 (plasmid) [Paraburkholderia caribensis MBA4]|uniref:Uncharacterized protein n=1 Tax=Paraburkholderia caribensis MBA4 TaxID=1323664 RepID=A0A0P0RQG0_9BURK|nr:hypothetical protein K788_0001854 [Paraburkholderia caribensis MBA4]